MLIMREYHRAETIFCKKPDSLLRLFLQQRVRFTREASASKSWSGAGAGAWRWASSSRAAAEATTSAG